MVAGFENCIRAYILKDLKKFAQLQSCDNPHGIHAVAYDEEIITLATPHIQPGSVYITNYKDG